MVRRLRLGFSDQPRFVFGGSLRLTCSRKSDHVNKNACDVRSVRPEVDPAGVPIPPAPFGTVEVAQAIVAPTDDIVIHDHNAGDGAQKDRVGRKIRREFVTARQEVPRAHGEPNGSSDETASSDILGIWLGVCGSLWENPAYDEAWEEGG